jgi:hypothetical protein
MRVQKVITTFTLLLVFTYAQGQDLTAARTAEPFSRWSIGLQGGGSYLTASFANSEASMRQLGISESTIDDYHKQLRNGWHAGVDAHYLITRSFGVGLKYSLFATSIQVGYAVLSDYYWPIPIYYYTVQKEKIYLNYIGPSVVFQHWLDKSNRFGLNGQLSAGYAHYRDEVRFDPYQYHSENSLMEGGAIGGNAQLSFDYYLLPWLSAGANIGYFYTTFNKVTYSTKHGSNPVELNKGYHINMSHIHYSLGVRFHF